MNKPEEYGICIRLITQDDADIYEGRVNELPDLKVYCDTYSEAYEELVGAIEAAQTMFAEQGREFPNADPGEDHFSGRVTLRMSKSLHRCVHEKALNDGTSLNQWIVEAVALRTDKRMVSADSVIVANQGRTGATEPTQTMFLQTQHLATVRMGSNAVWNVFGIPGIHEAMTHIPLVVTTPTPRLSHG